MANTQSELSVKITADASGMAKATATAAKSLEDLSADIKDVDSQSINITADVDLARVNRDIASLRAILDGIEQRKVEADVDLDLTSLLKEEAKVRRALDDLDQRRVTIEAGIEVDTTGLSALGGLDLGGLAAGAAGLGSAFSGWKLVSLAADVETTKIALSSLTGSVEEGAQAFDDLQRFAATTPYELDQVTTAARSLLAAGVEANQLPEMLTDLGNAASAVGAPLEEVAIVFQQMMTKGKISNEELLQLAERGVPAYTALAGALGVTVAEVQKMATAGELGSAEIEQLSQALGDMFPTSMADQAESLNGQLSTLGDNVTQIGGQIGAVMLPAVKDLVGAFNDLLGPVAFITGKFAEMPDPVKRTVGQFVILTGVVGSAAFFGPKVITAIVKTTAALDLLGNSAVIAGNKLRTLGAGLAIGATIIGLNEFDKALGRIFNTTYDSSRIDRDLEHLVATGVASGEMAKTFGGDLSGLSVQISTVTSKIPQLTDKIFGIFPGDTSVEEYSKNIDALDKKLADLVEGGHADQAAQIMKMITDAAAEEGTSVKDTTALFDDYNKVLETAASNDKAARQALEIAEAEDAAAASIQNHIDWMARLAEGVEAAAQEYDELVDSFTAFHDETIAGRSAVYDYQGAVDDLAESLLDGNTFSPDLEQGRTNWDNLAAFAEAAGQRVQDTWADKGRGAAVKMQTAYRDTLHTMLTDSGIESGRAWEIVNQVLKKPHKMEIELDDANLVRLEGRLKALKLEKANIAAEFTITEGMTPKEIQRTLDEKEAALEPINAKIHGVVEKLGPEKDKLDDAANPGGEPRDAGIKAKVDPVALATATTQLNLLTAPRTVPIIPVLAAGTGLNLGQPAAPRTGPTAAPNAGLTALRGIGPAVLDSSTPTPKGAWGGGSGVDLTGLGRMMMQPITQAPAASPVTRLGPKQVPIAVYLDGVEIAHRIEARRSMAAISSVRRSA